MEEDILCKREQQVATLISDKIDFKTKFVTRDKEGHFLKIKFSIHQEDIPIIYTPNNSPQIYEAKLTELKGNTQFNKNHWRP